MSSLDTLPNDAFLDGLARLLTEKNNYRMERASKGNRNTSDVYRDCTDCGESFNAFGPQKRCHVCKARFRREYMREYRLRNPRRAA